MSRADPSPQPAPLAGDSPKGAVGRAGRGEAARSAPHRVTSLIGIPSSISIESDLAREVRAVLPSKTRVGIVLAIVFLTGFIPIDTYRLHELFRESLVIRFESSLLLAIFYAVTLTRLGEPLAYGIAGASLAVLSFAVFSLVPLAPGPLDHFYLEQVIFAEILILGSSLFLPVNGRTMFGLAMIPFSAQILATLQFDFTENLRALGATLVAVVIAAAAAHCNYGIRRKELEGRLAKEILQQSRADFVATLTHDIKNPLGVIGGYVQMLQDEEKTLSPEGLEYLTRIDAAARRALMLAVNFLYVSRIGAGRLKLVRAPTDLPRILHHVVTHQRCLASLKKISFAEEIEEDLPSVDADEVQIDRVFSNLINNAIKFAPEESAVRVQMHRSGADGVEVVVEDSGQGLPAEAPERIFERYAGVSTSTESTGLGLFIVKTIMEAHGGKVSAENRGDAPGARFRVWLPIRGPQSR